MVKRAKSRKTLPVRKVNEAEVLPKDFAIPEPDAANLMAATISIRPLPRRYRGRKMTITLPEIAVMMIERESKRRDISPEDFAVKLIADGLDEISEKRRLERQQKRKNLTRP